MASIGEREICSEMQVPYLLCKEGRPRRLLVAPAAAVPLGAAAAAVPLGADGAAASRVAVALAQLETTGWSASRCC